MEEEYALSLLSVFSLLRFDKEDSLCDRGGDIRGKFTLLESLDNPKDGGESDRD